MFIFFLHSDFRVSEGTISSEKHASFVMILMMG